MTDLRTPLGLFNGRYWRINHGQRLLRTSIAAVATGTIALNTGNSLASMLATMFTVAAALSFLLGLARKAPVSVPSLAVEQRDKQLVFLQSFDDLWPKTLDVAGVLEGWTEPAGNLWRVWFTLRGGERMSVEVATHDEALALLRAVRCAAEQKRFKRTFSQRALTGVLFAAGMGGSFCLAASLNSVLALALGVVAVTALWAVTRALRVEVGAEGVRLGVSVWSYFVGYGELEWAFNDPEYLVLGLKGGRQVKYFRGQHGELGTAVAQRITEGLEAYRARLASAPVAQLRRGGATVARWREMLRELLFSSAPLRSVPLSREDLVRVVVSVDVPAEERIGAALALGSAPDTEHEEAPEKVRVALDGCASPALRSALQSALEGELTETLVDAAVREERTRRAPQ